MDFYVQRRDGNEKVKKKKNNMFNKQNNNFSRAAHFFAHLYAFFARLQRENAQFPAEFRVLWRTKTSNDEILFLFLNLDMVLRNSGWVRLHLTK